MASPSGSGTSSGSSGMIQNSGSEEELQQLMDQRKRKRMISNRLSARRSRMRKQKHLDDLMEQVTQLRNDNSQIVARINVATHQYLNVEAENSVLRAQAAELYNRLQSLNQIIDFMNANGNGGGGAGGCFGIDEPYINNFPDSGDAFMNNSWNNFYVNQPLMASADILHY